jgi:hypothetical protein
MTRLFYLIFPFLIFSCNINKNQIGFDKPNYNYINELFGYQISFSDSSIRNNPSDADIITIKDSTGSVFIRTVSDFVDSSLKFKDNFRNYVKERFQGDCTAYGSGGLITTSEIKSIKGFKNKNDVTIIMAYVAVKDSFIDRHKSDTHICGPSYYIELKKIKIEFGFVDRAIFICGDLIPTKQILANFKYIN